MIVAPQANFSSPVVIVDDETHILDTFSLILRSSGIDNVKTIDDGNRVMPFLNVQRVSAVVLDLIMPHTSGIKLLAQIKQEFPSIPVIIMTAINDLDTAVECMKEGAFDYLVKPVEKIRFVELVKKALEINELRNQVHVLKRYLLSGTLSNKDAFSLIFTQSRKLFAVCQYAEAIAKSQQPVLINGETGVGKELIARAIHDLSGRKGKFVAVNAAGLDDMMFSDTLFGHEKGAYTGADNRRDGLIAQAEGGTLFLDEIGDVSEASQIKVLRLLEEGVYYPLGSDMDKHSDARIVASTNRNLYEMMASGKFRKDLYYRLHAHHVEIPPLRERLEDIPLLVNKFLEDAAVSMNRKKPTVPPELYTLLSTYHFPGNVRELKAMVYDAAVQHKGGVLSMESFKKAINSNKRASGQALSGGAEKGPVALSYTFSRFPTFKETEEYLIEEAMKLSKGNQTIASSLLGITRQALYKRLRNKKRYQELISQ
ncbi:MAG: sigma-54-dependent Fis family transcriptional regulator [Nitrospirae bacterium]|nr:sigma-54-dependent Fis family transcriptional regulator [Nitrospirota bacterium]